VEGGDGFEVLEALVSLGVVREIGEVCASGPGNGGYHDDADYHCAFDSVHHEDGSEDDATHEAHPCLRSPSVSETWEKQEIHTVGFCISWLLHTPNSSLYSSLQPARVSGIVGEPVIRPMPD